MIVRGENALDALAARAWTKADEMKVLGDHLLETGAIVLPDEPSEACRTHGPWWDLECAMRDWILYRFYGDALEVRITGGPDAIVFVVTTTGPSRPRVRVFGVDAQESLLGPA